MTGNLLYLSVASQLSHLQTNQVVIRHKYQETFVVKFFYVLKRLGQFRFVYGFHRGTWWYIKVYYYRHVCDGFEGDRNGHLTTFHFF